VTMRLSSIVMEIWPFEVLPGRLFQEQRLVVGQSVGPQYYNSKFSEQRHEKNENQRISYAVELQVTDW